MSRPSKVTKLETRVNKLGFSIETECRYKSVRTRNSYDNNDFSYSQEYEEHFKIRLPSGRLSTNQFRYRDDAMNHVIENYDEESMFLRFSDDLEEAAKGYERAVKRIEKSYKKWGFKAI